MPIPTVQNCTKVFHIFDILVCGCLRQTDGTDDLLARFLHDFRVLCEAIDRKCQKRCHLRTGRQISSFTSQKYYALTDCISGCNRSNN